MNPRRQMLCWALLAGGMPMARSAAAEAVADDGAVVSPERRLAFPRDHGAHIGSAIEWWYVTGWLAANVDRPDPAKVDAQGLTGFQITFFRSRTGLAETLPGRLAPRQLLFAHAAVTRLDAAAGRRHRHGQRMARWNGDPARPAVHAASADTDLALAGWRLWRDPSIAGAIHAPAGAIHVPAGAEPGYRAEVLVTEAGFALQLKLQPTQPILLQGQSGYSRKGPATAQASHYLSQPQLDVQAQLTLDGRQQTLRGRAWLDHEWSNSLLAGDAVGWDWIGINMVDGSALTVFVLRRADGSALWAGGSFRRVGAAPGNFAPNEVQMRPGRIWTSPATGGRYPVVWRIETPVGTFELAALIDEQELDSRASTGAVYWEGLAELRDAAGRRAGLGYLEMTGRVAPLRLG